MTERMGRRTIMRGTGSTLAGAGGEWSSAKERCAEGLEHGFESPYRHLIQASTEAAAAVATSVWLAGTRT